MTELLSTTPGFDEQFADAHIVDSWRGEAEYVQITPENPESNVPILIASGWSQGRKAYKESAEEAYRQGRTSILVDHARHGGIKSANNTARPLEVEEFHNEILHKANTLMEIIDDVGAEKVDVIAHSEGALNTVVAALQKPEKFSTIILAMPAGMIGSDSVLKLAGRFAPKMVLSVTKDMIDNPNIAAAINTDGTKYIAKNPVKAAKEVQAMAETSIDDTLELLRAKGIKVGVLQSRADTVFPAHRIEQNVRLDGHFANVDAYASVNARWAGHDELLINPKRATVAAIQMIRQFE